ncbi:MAG: hypothetical protein E6Q85_04715 [Thiothrix sp.]|nr:MAG: hypothetical protein E6Q85_04715 [Thiothrix sp.]
MNIFTKFSLALLITSSFIGGVANAGTSFEKNTYLSPKGLSVYSKISLSDDGRVDHYHWYTNGTSGVPDGWIGYDMKTIVTLRDSSDNVLHSFEDTEWFNCQCGQTTSHKKKNKVFNLPIEIIKKVDTLKSTIDHFRFPGEFKDPPKIPNFPFKDIF